MQQLLSRYVQVPERVRYPVAGCIALLLVVLYYFFIHADQQETLTQAEAQRQTLETKRVEKRAYADNLSRYEARFAELQQSLNTARSLLPDSSDVPQFLAQLNNSAHDAGLSIERLEPKEEVSKDFYAEVPFKVQAHGSYHEVAMFIDQVGKADRIVNVSDLAMTAPKTENQKVVVNSTFLVRTYRFLADSNAATTDDAKKKVAPK